MVDRSTHPDEVVSCGRSAILTRMRESFLEFSSRLRRVLPMIIAVPRVWSAICPFSARQAYASFGILAIPHGLPSQRHSTASSNSQNQRVPRIPTSFGSTWSRFARPFLASPTRPTFPLVASALPSPYRNPECLSDELLTVHHRSPRLADEPEQSRSRGVCRSLLLAESFTSTSIDSFHKLLWLSKLAFWPKGPTPTAQGLPWEMRITYSRNPALNGPLRPSGPDRAVDDMKG